MGMARYPVVALLLLQWLELATSNYVADVASYTDDMRRVSIEHWLRPLAYPDDCTGAPPGFMVPDKTDCTKFYACIGGVPTPDPTPCGDDFTCFVPSAVASVSGKCVLETTNQCEDPCKAASVVCSTECPPAGGTGVIADTTSCNKYYLCNGAGQVELYCPSERPHFNGVTCVNDPATCCKCQRETCAGDMFELLADPQNCHSYYACLNLDGGTEFTPQGPYQCDNGGSFINGACDDKTTECENACDA
ncbi:unnamed protein product, partial [Meganyctiphanes norvegica]